MERYIPKVGDKFKITKITSNVLVCTNVDEFDVFFYYLNRGHNLTSQVEIEDWEFTKIE